MYMGHTIVDRHSSRHSGFRGRPLEGLAGSAKINHFPFEAGMSRFAILRPHYWELILFQTYAGLRAEASRTYLSCLWWVLEPVLFMLVFYIVFGLLYEQGTEDYVAFLLVGMVTWKWFANSISHGMLAIHAKGHLIAQVDLPKEIFPTVEIAMDIVKFAFVFALLLVFLWIYGIQISMAYLALPLILVTQLMLLTMFTYLAAAIIPFVPDLKFLIETLLLLAFLVSGIFFSGASIPEQYQFYFYLNPMANLIEAYRDILIHGTWPDWGATAKVGLFAFAGFCAARLLLRRFDHVYPRIVEV